MTLNSAGLVSLDPVVVGIGSPLAQTENISEAKDEKGPSAPETIHARFAFKSITNLRAITKQSEAGLHGINGCTALNHCIAS